jgi:Family of unknown function (DUF5522)
MPGSKTLDQLSAEAHGARLPLDHPDREAILAAHRAAVAANQPGYTDPTTGLYVLTASFLGERDTCCNRGCRHCPAVEGGVASPNGGHFRLRSEETSVQGTGSRADCPSSR